VQLVAVGHDTETKSLKGLRLGVGWTVQVLPSQCSAKFWPIAVHDVAEPHETLSSTAANWPGLGVAWTLQLVPFQRSARVTNLVPLK
jgi:hypothetical protein